MMLPSEKQNSKLTSELIEAGLTEEQRLQLRSALGHADTENLAGTSFENSTGQLQGADSGVSPLSSRPAGLEGENPFAFYPSAGLPSQEHRPSLVDVVLEQLHHSKLRRQRPH